MANRQKAKGDGYERELAAYLNDQLFAGREQVFRTPLSGGGMHVSRGAADLTGTPDLHVEAKRVERLNIRTALAQAERNAAGTPDTPIVVNRRNREKTGESLVTLRLDEFLKLYAAYLTVAGYKIEAAQTDVSQDQEDLQRTFAWL